jgi:hypothetical protein
VALEIEIFGQLLPGQPRKRTMEAPAQATVRDIANTIGLDITEIGLVSIDGVQSQIDEKVRPDSRLCFFPYLAGG